MSKLLRIENTNMFLVVSEERFMKKLGIEAIVRIEENPCDDGIRRYEPQTPQWHEELDKLKEIKRKELYTCGKTDKKIFVDIPTVLVNYFYESVKLHISVNKIFELLNFVYESLQSSGKLECYDICFDLSQENLERIVLYNSDIFCTPDEDLEMTSIIYYRNLFRKTDKQDKERLLDETLSGIIKAFVEKNR